MSIALRPYQPNDEAAILELFEASFGRPMSAAYWTWRFADNPIDAPKIDLAWDGSTLAGHYAVSPAELVINGTCRKVALSMTTMTHPDYRGRDLFGQMADSLYERLTNEGYACVFGFPNRYSHRLFNRRLAWSDIGEVSTLTLLSAEARLKAPSNVKLSPVEQPPTWLADLPPSPGERIGPSRRPETYAWRLSTPGVAYLPFEVVQDGNPIGFVVLKWYGDEALDIVDLCAQQGQDETVVTAVVQHAINAGAQRVHTWASLWHPSRSALERVGFTTGGPVTMLGARWFEPVVDLDPYDLRAWRYSMLTSDVY